jgi:hypothetical protein
MDHKTKRHRIRFWLLSLLVLIAVTTLAVLWLDRLRSPFNEGVYNQVQIGMTLAEVTTLLNMPPGRYNVSPEEQFVNMRHEGKIAFGNREYDEVKKEPGVFDIVSRQTKTPVASFRTWANAENGIYVLTQEDKVIGKMHVVSLTSFNRANWLKDLRRWLRL